MDLSITPTPSDLHPNSFHPNLSRWQDLKRLSRYYYRRNPTALIQG